MLCNHHRTQTGHTHGYHKHNHIKIQSNARTQVYMRRLFLAIIPPHDLAILLSMSDIAIVITIDITLFRVTLFRTLFIIQIDELTVRRRPELFSCHETRPPFLADARGSTVANNERAVCKPEKLNMPRAAVQLLLKSRTKTGPPRGILPLL